MAIQYVTDKTADVTFNLSEPYVIPSANNVLTITVDGGAPQTATLTSGTRTAAQLVTDLSGLTGVTVSTVTIGYAITVRIRTTSALGNSSSLAVSNNLTPANNYVGWPLSATVTGGSPISTFFDAENGKQSMINAIETALLTAGWSTLSGHGATALTMQSQMSPDPQNLKMRVTFKDNGGSSIQFSVANMWGSRASSNSTSVGSLTPKAGRGWQIIANKYQVCIICNGSWEGGTFAFFGVPWLPPNLRGVLYECIHFQSGTNGDNDAAIRGCFRTDFFGAAQGQAVNNNAWRGVITNGNIWDGNFNPSFGDITLFAPIPANAGSVRWMNGYKPMSDAVVAWGPTSQAEEAKAMGLLWESFVSREAYVGDHQVVLDGHTFQSITFGRVENQNPTWFLKVA